jgi:hypothetical protein
MQPSANGCLADAYKSVKTLMDGIARDMKKSMITDSERNLKKLLRLASSSTQNYCQHVLTIL